MESSAEVELARLRMVREQLQRHGISDRRVLEAMGRVPRERFVDVPQPQDAYADRALPIECGQTISQPVIVAMMTEALRLRGDETVLDIGTGSGYQTAILAELAARVVSIEIHAELSARAGRVLTELGYQNVKLVVGDGTLGWAEEAPYRAILVAAATAVCPPALIDQLADGGTLVIPLGGPTSQVLERLELVGGKLRRTSLTNCRFVPLLGGPGTARDSRRSEE
ncbi:MAG TPA: protein-L-isoaspartate(D-aspartate) O-methyltransferase [Pirellulales bacterium]|jgi:protein-L-isoaspartate(D-aspartate) O-methyltransferase